MYFTPEYGRLYLNIVVYPIYFDILRKISNFAPRKITFEVCYFPTRQDGKTF